MLSALDSNLKMASEMFQANRIKCFIIIWMAIGSLICLVDFEFSCDFIKDSDKIIQHLAVNIDIGYGENSGYLLTIQFLVYGGIFFMLYCAILHAKKSQQGIWSKVETIGLIFLTMSHILSLFTVRMGKIFISCAKDPNYDLLFVAAVGSIFLSLGNAMALFYQSVKKPTIPGADYHLKYHIP
ncbi:ATP-dependent 6-phosphofructokinase subunit beta [Trichinella spiralis]|uniref:ATP-dependent 6-phosphofructokinase subunit beta n=1 Tax=Trichinella spiralis TaxID=6334 RepID=A0ABR3KRG4_TRISP